MGLSVNNIKQFAMQPKGTCGVQNVFVRNIPCLGSFKNIKTSELKYAPLSSDVVCINKDKQFIENFFEGITKDFTEPKGIFKFRKRIIHGSQPTANTFKHGIDDPRLSQPIQLMEHSNYIYDLSDVSNLNANFVKQYLYKDVYNQVRQKDNLYLEIIQVQKEHQRKGIASDLLKKIIGLSKEKYNSKLTLNALPPPGTEGQIPSPSLAYWSKGFRFVDENANKQMLKVKIGELPLTEAPCGFMFLDETIAK